MSARSLSRLAGVGPARSLRGLDLLNFFLANVQTGFGPFVAVYLTTERWTQVQIGLVLSVGTICGMLSQVPAGALIDATPRKRLAAGAAILAIMASAAIFAFWPEPLPVLIAELLHGFASAMVLPAIAAITLALVRRGDLGERFGRNASWAAVGSGFAAGAMGGIGYTVSNQAVFLLTALLAIPALIALGMIGRTEGLARAPVPARSKSEGSAGRELLRVFTDRRLLIFAGTLALFQLGNAAMLQLAGGELTARVGSRASLIIAACIVVPQVVVALLSPWVGRAAERWGRRPVLVVGLLALPIRALLFALTANPVLVVGFQALDGIAGAGLGVLMPLVAADVTAGTNRFNVCMGALALTGGIGATISTTLAGAIADGYGIAAAFIALAVAGLSGVLIAATVMPETRPAAAKPQLPVGTASPRGHALQHRVNNSDARAHVVMSESLERAVDAVYRWPGNRV